MDNIEQAPDITAFLASSIHDMKNSISVLINFMEDQLADIELQDSPALRKMPPMLYEVKRVNSNLIQLLTIYKVGSTVYPFDLTENSLGEFMEEVLSQSKHLLDYQNIQMEYEFDPDLYWYFDRELVSGVISHALNNSAHYTKDKLRLSAKQTDAGLEFHIEDNGQGYPPSVLETGHAIEQGVNFSTGSTGLGLYFSSMVAKMHKNQGKIGSITLKNGGAYGGGCFILRLP